MSLLYNQKVLKDRRRDLRKSQTNAEKFFWKHINKDKIYRLRFLRQYSIGPYILDFYCSKIRLGIEIDGEVHKEKERILYDKDREKYLKSVGINIIRFWNNDVLCNIRNVLEDLRNKINSLNKKW